MTLNRRQFIHTTTATGLALSGVPFIHAAPKAKQYRIALIGSGWWGMNILKEAMAGGQCKAVALCDVDQDALELAAEEVKDLSGAAPKTYGDFRELLDKEKIDIAIIATPDHWHALNTIAAIEKGAHIFVEKPTGHTIMESRAMLNAAQAAGRVIQVGLHRRIGPHFVSGMKFLKDGGAGDIGMVRTFVHSRGGAELPNANSEVPEGLDWEMYCGPAPLRPFNSRIHPGGFRNFLDYANGTLGDWGVHWLDQILLWTDEKYPRTVYSTGGRPIRGEAVLNEKEQTTDAPDSQVATFEFESFTATWEHRRFAGNEAEKHSIGCCFYGTKGTFHMGWRDGWTFYPDNSKEQVIHQDAQLQEPDGHSITLLWADFMNSIETGKKPVCDIESSHRSTNMSLLGMLSYKLGRSVEWDGAKERCVGDEEANALLRREYRGEWKYPA
ncbi:MAG: Gfo/Idh/MocA family oxidoreductase [Planctomycetota bacterium]|nr:Gfo/Idh/MocA family oxidoreductase [Planctomycetota bacterium]